MRTAISLAIVLFTGISANAQKKSQATKPADLSAGKVLYEKYKCNSCHGNKGVQQGDLTKAYQKYTDEQMRSYITDPRAFGNLKMPVYGRIIPAQDYPPLLRYIRFLGEKQKK